MGVVEDEGGRVDGCIVFEVGYHFAFGVIVTTEYVGHQVARYLATMSVEVFVEFDGYADIEAGKYIIDDVEQFNLIEQ